MKKLITRAVLLLDLWVIIVATTVFTSLYLMGSNVNLISITIFVTSFVFFNFVTLITLSLSSLKQKYKKLKNA